MNKLLLYLVMLPRQLYAGLGVNVSHLRAILTTKLMMDDRRPNAMMAARYSNKKEGAVTHSTIWMMIMSAVMGAIYLMSFRVGANMITHLVFYYSMFLVMLCMMLVSDFTSVLIDVQDNYIILPKPVNDRTVLTARMLHIFIHICKLTIPMMLPGFIYLGIKIGIAAVGVDFLLCILIILLSIFLINALYIIVLRVTTPERFKNIISYFQIIFAVVVYASFQLLPRISDMDAMDNLDISGNTSMLPAPPYWFACAFETMTTGQVTQIQLIATILALVFPFISIWLVVRFLAPAFNQKLAMISGSEGASSVAPAPTGTYKKGVVHRIAGLLSGSKAEETGFLFTWKNMTRSRNFKVKVYPQIGYMLVLMVMPMFTRGKTLPVTDKNGVYNFTLIFLMYASTLVVIPALSMITYSDKFKAAWIFLITPLQKPGHIINGAIKATLLHFFFPIVVMLFVAGLATCGPEVLPNLILATLNQVILFYLIGMLSLKALPFSQPMGKEEGGRSLFTVLVLILAGLVGGLHYLIFRNIVVIVTLIVLAVIALWLLSNSVKGNESVNMASLDEE